MDAFILVSIVLGIVFLVRWWKMTTNIEEIRQQVTQSNPKITYLVAIGEKEMATKAALRLLVDKLLPIYNDSFEHNKAEAMNKEIMTTLPKITKLGLTVPDYVTGGEKFIAYMNALTGNTVTP